MLGDVCDVEPVRCLGTEVAVDQIVRRCCRLVPAGAAAQPPAVNTLQASASHEAFDPAVTDSQVLPEDELRVNAAVPVGAVGGGMDVADGVHQVGLFPAPVTGRSGAPLVEAGGRDLQNPADRCDGDPVSSELADYRVDHFGRTFSRAK